MSDLEDDQNPVLIQAQSRRGVSTPAPTPLLLFHDGGGTLFSYFLLEPLGRDVSGFADPRAESERPWQGGILEMAEYYYDCMKAAMRPGPVLLGGWSFGGHLALQLAHIISSDSLGGFEVAGIIMIDSSCPLGERYTSKDGGEHTIPFKEDVPVHMRKVAQASMDRTVRMLAQWNPPTWPTGSSGPPRALLLRAQESVDQRNQRSPKLDWELYPHDFIESVTPIPGNHFNLFEVGNVSILSAALREGCKQLEKFYRNIPSRT
ncbi:thioesterase domain containing protein [Diplodia corticola]|uniref:Thioesterase domain containing protein n=1 Tax=Diplodia corticola TaxID=236234 RepID=A0A1J9R5X2_9PEZI|nr:thioesterase domain containing protein [Diplodia corticola]OJD36918.1 thioesterase domain containing protein [Diplodia corticola]